MGISYVRVRATLWCHLCGTTVHNPATVAPHQKISSPLFWTNLQQNAQTLVDTCRYDLLAPLLQVIVSTKTRVFDYVICEDQKYDSRGFILYRHLNQWQATRGVRQFSNTRSPTRPKGVFLSDFVNVTCAVKFSRQYWRCNGLQPIVCRSLHAAGARAGAKIRTAKLQNSPYFSRVAVSNSSTYKCVSVTVLQNASLH